MSIFSSIKNPRYVAPDNSAIMVDATTLAGASVVFVASPNDAAGAQIFADCVAGKYGAVTAYAGPPLATVQAQANAALAAACGATIMGGFSSSALGAAYSYPSTPTDQANLAASVLDSMLNGSAPNWSTPFMCADASGTWARRPHTAAQIQQVGRDGKAFVLACLTKLDTLRDEIAAATTAAAVAAIVWSKP